MITKKIRKQESISRALFRCIEVPFCVQKTAHKLWPYLRKVAPIFNIETKSDLLVAVKCLETGVYGAYQNVLINLKGADLTDEKVNLYIFLIYSIIISRID